MSPVGPVDNRKAARIGCSSLQGQRNDRKTRLSLAFKAQGKVECAMLPEGSFPHEGEISAPGHKSQSEGHW